MEIVTAIAAGKSIVELGKEIALVVETARESPDVTRSVLLYLKAAQAAVGALGLERQRILTDVSKCDVGDKDQVEALFARLHVYLYEYNVYPHLRNSFLGLTECRKEIEKEAKAAWWRKRDKEAAVQAFSSTLHTLVSTLRGLQNFYPGGSGSGMGIQTLWPIYELVDRVLKTKKHWYSQDAVGNVLEEIQATNEELGELALEALRDNSHTDWILTTAEVEGLIAQLRLAFSIEVTQKEAKGS